MDNWDRDLKLEKYKNKLSQKRKGKKCQKCAKKCKKKKQALEENTM